MSEEAPEKGTPKIVTGIVTSDRMQKTRSVRVSRLERHRRYGKYIRRHSTYMAHDEKEQSREGDTVRIEETRPLSKRKRWRLVEIVTRSRYTGVPEAEVSDGVSVEGMKEEASQPEAAGGSP